MSVPRLATLIVNRLDDVFAKKRWKKDGTADEAADEAKCKRNSSTHRRRGCSLPAPPLTSTILADRSGRRDGPLRSLSRQNRLQRFALLDDVIEERGNARHAADIGMRQQPPASRQLRNGTEHADQIRLRIAERRRQRP
jgi:hypothetical protein